MAPSNRSAKQRRKIRRIRITGWTALSSLLVTIVGFLVWAYTPYPDQPEGLRELYATEDIAWSISPDLVVMGPAQQSGPLSGDALLFLPGARVSPHAYATTFYDVVAETGLTVILPRPTMNLALADGRSLEDFQALSPSTPISLVGGHSMGGVQACTLATDSGIERLILFASYCAVDLQDTEVDVLNVLASKDELIDRDAVVTARELMPQSYQEVTIDGASHASFGDYGPQGGDGIPTLSRTEAIEKVSDILLRELAR
jgi:pimeloyl-ACP methyl ester carboxylesterase